MTKEIYEKIMQLFDLAKYKEIIWYKQDIINHNYNDDLYEVLWWSYMRLFEYKKAIDIFKQVLNQNENSFRANYWIASCYFKQEDYKLSQKFYRLFLALDKPLSDTLKIEVLNNLWLSYLHQNKYNDALKWYLKALATDPNDVDVLNNIWMAYHYKWNEKKALEYFIEAGKVDPNDEDIKNKIRVTKELLN